MSAKRKFFVVGDPINHSLSPIIHEEFASQFGLAIDYQKARITQNNLKDFLATAKNEKVSGINLTVPLKEEAFLLADQCTERAIFAEAVNTIWFLNGQIFCDNTDGIGIVRDLEKNMGWPLIGKKILIIGAGGAARGILGPILNEMPKLITVTNRTLEKSVLLKKLASRDNVKILKWGEKTSETADIVLNCTSLSLSEKTPDIDKGVIRSDTLCYDLAYGPKMTAFEKWATEGGVAQAVNGLGMLVEQAAESFSIWHGLTPDTGALIRKLKTRAN